MNRFFRLLLLSLISTAFFSTLNAQLLTTVPAFPSDTSTVTIRFDASRGNKALMNTTTTSDVYIHVGVITNLSQNSGDWKYSKFTWASLNAAARATFVGNNVYTYTIANVRSFFGVPATEAIQKIVLVFRNGAGTVVAKNDDNTDMFISLYSAAQNVVRFTNPVMNPYFVPAPASLIYSVGQSFPVSATAKSNANLVITHNGTAVATASNATAVNGTINITTAGNQVIKVTPNGNAALADSFSFYVAAPTATVALPAGVQDGINYNAGNTSVTLVLHAPGKNRAVILGDFNNWTPAVAFQMNRTPDGQKFWLTINGLTPGVEYGFQYVVDDVIKIADPYSEKILDPWNDPFINDVANFTVYPNLKAYPTNKTTGYVSVLQTAKPAFTWTSTSTYTRPAQNKLLVYELHVRDFVATHSWKTLKDTLNYLQNLGINAIELMPFNEFDGNDSWGYNPNFYNAPDKYYGTDIDLKAFIDECHKRNIAVIQDIVFNHAWGSCPLVQLYFDAVNNRPAANNPWFNQTAPHPFGFGNDFNFSSGATRYFFQRILEYWMSEYKVDGFRFDLSKGFTNKFTGTDVAAWGNYDVERVANIKWLADIIWNKQPTGYVVLEHLGEWGEENEFMNYKQGMMPWHRLDTKFNEATMGWGGCNQDISEVYYKHNNNFSRPLRMGNLESHDEERLMYKNINFGKTVTGYDVKNLATGLQRVQAAAAFHVLMPGPKMIWQFTELGYDFSINACSNGVLGIGDACRTSRKPIRWDYLQNTDRRRLYNVMSALMKLKNKYSNTFATDLAAGYDMGCNTYKFYQISTADLNVTVVGNFDVIAQTKAITFQKAGSWTDYISGTTSNFSTATQNITLQPGEFRVFLDRNITMSNIDAPVVTKNFSVYFKKPATWTSARIHFWNAVPTNAVAGTVWPGNTMVQQCGDWYRWDFTNLASINIVFNDGGTINKTVDLTASGTAYYDNGWLTTAPVIGTTPKAIFTATPNTGTAPLAVSVNGAASTSCSGIISYNWTFGNGTTATGAIAATTYSTAGTYSIKLVITDNQNRKDSTTQLVTVATAPTAGFTLYFKKPADWATGVRIHYWNVLPNGSVAATTWPGVPMTADCNSWYRFTFPSTVTSTSVIFNDGAGKQTVDLTGVNSTRYYDNGWLATAPNLCNTPPVVSISPASTTFTDSIRVTLTATDDKAGSTIYYTTNGTASSTSSTVYTAPFWVKATTTVNATARDSDGAMATNPVTAVYTRAPAGITVYFENTGNWTQPKVYCWSAIPATYVCAAWPGVNMTKVANCGNWWSFTFAGVSSTNLIFNSGTGTQSVDLNRAAAGLYSYSWTTKAWVNGAPVCTGARSTAAGTDNEVSVAISPNPIYGNAASVSVHTPWATSATINITDAFGRVVKRINRLNIKSGTSFIPLEMGATGSGIYTALVEVNGRITPLKFVVAR